MKDSFPCNYLVCFSTLSSLVREAALEYFDVLLLSILADKFKREPVCFKVRVS